MNSKSLERQTLLGLLIPLYMVGSAIVYALVAYFPQLIGGTIIWGDPIGLFPALASGAILGYIAFYLERRKLLTLSVVDGGKGKLILQSVLASIFSTDISITITFYLYVLIVTIQSGNNIFFFLTQLILAPFMLVRFLMPSIIVGLFIGLGQAFIIMNHTAKQ